MTSPTLLGFDFGSRRIGIAVGQRVSGTASGIGTVSVTQSGPDWSMIAKLVDTWQPDLLVVGLPLDMAGESTSMSNKACHFAEQLKQRFKLPVEMEDERLSSNAADSAIRYNAAPGKSLSRRRKLTRDQVAAALIVESFMQRKTV